MAKAEVCEYESHGESIPCYDKRHPDPNEQLGNNDDPNTGQEGQSNSETGESGNNDGKKGNYMTKDSQWIRESRRI